MLVDIFCYYKCNFVGKKLRSYAKNRELERLRNKEGKPLDVEFDIHDKMTFNPVGTNAKLFKALVGTLARSIPYYYTSWEHAPDEAKDYVWPTIEVRFV